MLVFTIKMNGTVWCQIPPGKFSWAGGAPGRTWPVLTGQQSRAQPWSRRSLLVWLPHWDSGQCCSKMFSSRDALFCLMSPYSSQQRLEILAATVNPRSIHGRRPLALSLLQLCLWAPRNDGTVE